MITRYLLVVSVVALFIAIKLAFYQKNAEQKLLQSFKHNINRSLCTFSLCLGNDITCKMLDFRLDYARHADMNLQADYMSTFALTMKRWFDFWAGQQNEKIFFGTLKSENCTVSSAVAKIPSHYYSEVFERMVNISTTGTIVINDQWSLLPDTDDVRRLIVCSKDNTRSHSLLHNFFNSINNNSNYQSKVEIWTAAHLSVELLILKVCKLLKPFYTKHQISIAFIIIYRY